jgi:hypothetical protein
MSRGDSSACGIRGSQVYDRLTAEARLLHVAEVSFSLDPLQRTAARILED